jgi:hypothetical protein
VTVKTKKSGNKKTLNKTRQVADKTNNKTKGAGSPGRHKARKKTDEMAKVSPTVK